MKKIDKLKKKTTNFLYDHYHLKQALHECKGLACGILAAFIFAFGYTCFIAPYGDSGVPGSTTPWFHIVTGGVSGLSQNLNLILEMCGIKTSHAVIEGLGYTCFNIPLLIFAFFKVGKRFSIQTAINVVVTSLFISFLMPSIELSKHIAGNNWLAENNAPLRLLLAGCCTGLSSALAFRGELSCGGIDIVTYYFALRKSTSVGKYGTIINSFIIALYAVLTIAKNGGNHWEEALISVFFSIVYLFVVALVVDMINLRNKKVQLEFITTNEHLGEILISNFPHGATMDRAKGVYSGTDRYIFWMVVSTLESQQVIKLARKVDPNAFVTVTSLVQVYGKFFIKPIE